MSAFSERLAQIGDTCHWSGLLLWPLGACYATGEGREVCDCLCSHQSTSTLAGVIIVYRMTPREVGMEVQPHERFAVEVQLTPATVSAFAHTVGDVNPVHHDPRYAAMTRY